MIFFFFIFIYVLFAWLLLWFPERNEVKKNNYGCRVSYLDVSGTQSALHFDVFREIWFYTTSWQQ